MSMGVNLSDLDGERALLSTENRIIVNHIFVCTSEFNWKLNFDIAIVLLVIDKLLNKRNETGGGGRENWGSLLNKRVCVKCGGELSLIWK